jgi:hypothetical protein
MHQPVHVLWEVSGDIYSLVCRILFFFLVSWGGVRLSPLGTSANIWPIESAPDDR